jgi:hypothetical protein
MNDETLKDIQYLLLMYEAYIEDTTSVANAWEEETFKRLCYKYGFTKDNLHKGFDYLFC